MKKINFIGTVLASVTLLLAAGCKHAPQAPTPLPGYEQPNNSATGPGTGESLSNQPSTEATTEPTPIDYGQYATNLFDAPHNEDREKFKDDTINFDFDSATIKPSEESKLQDVANYFKNNDKLEGLIIEGNCDERGTENYNLSLGERRALAAREYLANLGVDAHRLKTVTYGASRPLDPGHDESAWKKNRRDDFVLVTAKQQ